MKKHTKSKIALFLALGMSFSAVTVSAAEYQGQGDVEHPVQVSGQYDLGVEKVVAVDIAWGSFDFNFSMTTDGNMQWDPDSLRYTGNTDPIISNNIGEDNNNLVTITNRSNTDVSIIADYSNTTDTTDFDGQLSTLSGGNELILPSASDSGKTTEGSFTFQFDNPQNAAMAVLNAAHEGEYSDDASGYLDSTEIGTINLNIWESPRPVN